MDLFSSMRVSASGLDAQTKRMNTISSNVANAETVGYHRKDPLVAAETDRESFGEILDNQLDENVQGVRVQDIVEDQRPQRMVYNPNHPQAIKDGPNAGYVEMPNINPVEEMANMISAQRSYEANVTAMNSAKQMAQKALEIGR
jgi:flagellar basal-body rod protein FlgC